MAPIVPKTKLTVVDKAAMKILAKRSAESGGVDPRGDEVDIAAGGKVGIESMGPIAENKESMRPIAENKELVLKLQRFTTPDVLGETVVLMSAGHTLNPPVGKQRLKRWAKTGIKSRITGQVVTLDFAYYGGELATSLEALDRFHLAVNGVVSTPAPKVIQGGQFTSKAME